MTPPDDPGQTAAVFERAPAREPAVKIPRRLDDGLVAVDPGWGSVQPIEIAPGVRTVGELEVAEHIRAGGIAIDTRLPEYLAAGTLPGAIAIPSREIAGRIGELEGLGPLVLFCNGPQCAATPRAIKALLAAGVAPETLLYYRGGIHDWVTLGFGLEPPAPAPGN